MGRIIALLVILSIVTCKPSTEEGIIENRDSIQLYLVKRAYQLKTRLDSLEHATKDSVLLDKIEYYRALNDANISGTLNYKRAVVRSYFFEDQYDQLEKDVAILTAQVKEYQAKYEESIRAEEATRYKLESEIERHKATRISRDKLQGDINEASILNPVNILVEPMGKNIWGKPIKTKIASKIGWINFYFTFPENKLATRETKNILIVMLSSDGKDSIKRDTEIDYVGNQITTKVILNGKSFTPGPHKVTLYINGESKHITTLDLLSR